MWHFVLPGPPAWSFMGSAVLVQLLVVLSSSAYACCAEERGPITNCSFSYNQDTFLCNIAELGYHIDTCPYETIADLDYIPSPIDVDSFNIKPYFTSCSPTDGYVSGLDASSCHTPCRQGNEAVHVGLNITFRADNWSSEDLREITISLRHSTNVRVHCVMFQFGETGLTNAATAQHEFYYDGFIGLVPAGEYTVSILTLPTNNDWSNSVSKKIQIPWETCWVADVKYHDTPFAVNLTLFQDLLYNFTSFDVHLYHNPDNPVTKHVDFSTAELYEMDGKWGTNIIFDCLKPTSAKLKLYIDSTECPSCDWPMTEIQVLAVPPTFSNCPEDIIHEVELRRFMSNTTPNVNWSPPTPIFQSKCMYGNISTHNPMDSTTPFQVGAITPVVYSAWQYASMARCTFNVQVRTVDTIPPRITSCPDNIYAQGDPRTKSLEVTLDRPTWDDASDTTMTIATPDIPDLQSPFNFPVGANTTVTYRITDAYDNTANCSISVYIEGDTVPPQVTRCPGNINTYGKPNMKSAEVSWASPQFNDASDTVMSIITPDIPDFKTSYDFPVGVITNVTYRITDAYNNSALCSFSVYVKETPSAPPLVIVMSCLAGLLLILLLAVIIWRIKSAGEQNNTGSTVSLEQDIACSPVTSYESGHGVPLDSLKNYPSESQFSIDKMVNTPNNHQIYPERSRSVPDMQQHSSGYMSTTTVTDEYLPSFGHPHTEPPSRLDSVEEEENRPLVWKRVPNRLDSLDEERSSLGSRFSSSIDDDSPVSLESTC